MIGRRTTLTVMVAAASGVLVTTAAIKIAGGTPGRDAAATTVPTGTAQVLRTTLTSRQQVNGTLGYAAPSTLVAPAGSTPAQVAQAQGAVNQSAVALHNARNAQSHVNTSGPQGQQAADQAQASVDSAQAQANSTWTALQAALDTEAVPPGVLTWLPQPGATIGRGERLYEVNGQPVVLMLGAQPMHRRLASGASGADVKQLEENLLALGFGSRAGLVADGHFGSADAAAVCDWQAALGVPQTGALDLGAVVFTPGPVRIAGLHGGPGSAYAPGQPVIDVTDTSRVVSVSLDAALQKNVKVGDEVTVQLPGANQPAAGKVSAVAGVAQAPSGSGGQQQGPVRATVSVTIRLNDPNAGAGLDQAPVRVAITDSVRNNVLAVPVTALVARSDGTFAVEVVRGSTRTPIKVTTGVFGDNGLVEISGTGLAVGDLVEVPKPL